MAGFVFFFLAPNKSDFDVALDEYLASRREDPKRSKKRDEFAEWMETIQVKKISRRFIPQCKSRNQKKLTALKSVLGTVTNISDDGGLIDDYIYFAPDKVNAFDNDDAIEVGQTVQADAEKQGPDGGWRATTVTRMSACHDRAPQHHGPSITCVTEVNGDSYRFEHGLLIEKEKFSPGYQPIVGDWVKLNVDQCGQIVSAFPLRLKEVTGKVTQTPRVDKDGLEVAKGSVNNEIQFSLGDCEDGYKPWRDDEVQVTAMESRQSWCYWRATSIRFISKGQKMKPEVFKSSNWVLRGGHPEMATKRACIPSFLPKYPIPENLKDSVENSKDVLSLLPSLKSGLSFDNYAARFSALIYLEEINADLEIRKHGIKGASLERCGSYICLHVPGMADGRPSLSIGDIVVLREPLVTSSMEYHGFIHHIIIDKEEILLKFHASFQDNFEVSAQFDVEFKYSRAPFRRCHFAVRLAQRRNWSELLFPTKISRNKNKQCWVRFIGDTNKEQHSIASASTSGMKTVSYINGDLNLRQKQAVERIIINEATRHPYILFGPPGTGKTVTLVEVILHLYRLLKWSRILVCAPSNSAVDVICDRLAFTGLVDEGDMVRFNAIRRLEGGIPKTIAKFCRSEEEVEKTSRYRIILTTCVNSGVFYGLQLPKDHFTHIVIDEAGQATEPEILIPIGLQTYGQIIMAGDPEQLGPVIMSPLANMYGLSKSLLERLMRLRLYERNNVYQDGYNPLIVTKLLQNYRSHSVLVEVPSRLFYMGELIACRKESKYKSLLQWHHLPTTGFPIIFHGIIGKQLRENDSPSLMNPTEVVQAVRYIKILTRDENVATDDIGIVTPYRKQVEKMRMMLNAVGLEGIKVGSVEEFQGQEKSIIIISTVRSNPGHSTTENGNVSIRGALGFLSNCKRFNVATTRAKTLMIILGNPFVLSIDQHWKALLKFSSIHGGYTGCDISSLELA